MPSRKLKLKHKPNKTEVQTKTKPTPVPRPAEPKPEPKTQDQNLTVVERLNVISNASLVKQPSSMPINRRTLIEAYPTKNKNMENLSRAEGKEGYVAQYL